MADELTINNIAVPRGERVIGSLHVGDLASHKVEVPVAAIAGKTDGPTLVITAGMHATEVVAIVAAHRLAREVDPGELKGNLIVLPLVNRYGFDESSLRVNPVDNVNLNRIFPGDPKGSISHQMAHHLFMSVISKANCYIDFHGGEIGESLSPFAVQYMTGDAEHDRRTEKAISAFGTKYVWQPASSSPNKADASEEAQNGYAITHASRRKAVSFIAEGGTEGKIDPGQVDFMFDGAINVMKDFGMLEGSPRYTELVKCPEPGYIHAHSSGICYLYTGAGVTVKRGQKLAEVKSLWGETLETVTAPFDAFVASAKLRPVVKTQDYLFLLLKLPGSP